MTHVWSVWHRPVFSTVKVADDVGNMRLDVRMELDEAWQVILQEEVVTAEFQFDDVALFWPDLPRARPREEQPFYRFQGPLGNVYVGTWTKWVTKFVREERLAVGAL